MAINYMLNENVMTLHLIVEIIKKIFLYKKWVTFHLIVIVEIK